MIYQKRNNMPEKFKLEDGQLISQIKQLKIDLLETNLRLQNLNPNKQSELQQIEILNRQAEHFYQEAKILIKESEARGLSIPNIGIEEIPIEK